MLHPQKFALLSFVAVALCDSECDKKGILIYEDLGCIPLYKTGQKCPTKFTCEGLEQTQNCRYRGKTYKDGEHVENNVTGPACQVGCFCSANEGRSSFTCAVLDCPEWLGVPISPGCYRKYSLNHCCFVEEACSPFENVKCEFEGKEYKEGDRFYPHDTCLSCVCQKGFKGKLEAPFCQNKHCGQQLRSSNGKIQNSCAPFYVKYDSDVVCCPDDWICPDGNEKIEGTATSEEVCKFGRNSTLKVGQSLIKTDFADGFGRRFVKVECECVVPPLLKCTSAKAAS